MLEWGRKAGDVRPIRDDGTVVAHLRPLGIRDNATVELDGVTWSYYPRGDELFGARTDDPKPAARATRVGRGTFAVHTERAEYRIERFGMPRSPYAIARAGVSIGSSGRAAWWSRRPTLDVEPATPLEHRMFLLWVAFVMRGRPGVRSRRGNIGGAAGPATGAAAFGHGGMDGGGDGGTDGGF